MKDEKSLLNYMIGYLVFLLATFLMWYFLPLKAMKDICYVAGITYWWIMIVVLTFTFGNWIYLKYWHKE
jgi:type VI protein secretion system component VasK